MLEEVPAGGDGPTQPAGGPVQVTRTVASGGWDLYAAELGPYPGGWFQVTMTRTGWAGDPDLFVRVGAVPDLLHVSNVCACDDNGVGARARVRLFAADGGSIAARRCTPQTHTHTHTHTHKDTHTHVAAGAPASPYARTRAALWGRRRRVRRGVRLVCVMEGGSVCASLMRRRESVCASLRKKGECACQFDV